MSQAVISVIGKLSRDAERNTSGTTFVKMSIPVSKGQGKPTTWYQATLFGKRAENDAFLALLKKGSIVSVSGEFEVREYDKNDGTKGYSPSILVNSIDVEFASKNEASETEF